MCELVGVNAAMVEGSCSMYEPFTLTPDLLDVPVFIPSAHFHLKTTASVALRVHVV